MNVQGNYYNKYDTKNFVAQKMMEGFFRSLKICSDEIPFSSFLEVGCGEGNLFRFYADTYHPEQMCGFDLGEDVVEAAQKLVPEFKDNIFVKSIYENGYADNSFDFVVCSEVLEHLDDPTLAMKELIRITKKYLLLSVPREPLWRFLNMVRMKYTKDWGNTPGHIQHWSYASFLKFAQEFGDIVRIERPTPWTMVLLQKHSEN